MKKGRIVLLTIILAMFILAMILVTKTIEESGHTTYPEACASQWLQDVITVEETLDCIEDYMKNEELKMQSQEP